jgi:hypothetical protein
VKGRAVLPTSGQLRIAQLGGWLAIVGVAASLWVDGEAPKITIGVGLGAMVGTMLANLLDRRA